MKILFMIYSMKNGGAERVVANLANRLSDKGHKITISVFDESVSDYQLNSKVSLISYKFTAYNKLATFIKGIQNSNKAYRDCNPDIIISFLVTTNIYSIISNIFTRKPIIISERNDPNSDPEQWYYRLLRKITYRFSNGFVFQTTDAKRYFSKKIQQRSVVIQNPVSVLLKEQSKEKSRNKEIVAVGRLEHQKNHKMLIEAFSKISREFTDYKLVIYGEGSLRGELEELILQKELVGRVLLPGRVNDVLERIENAALFVLSSNYEGMSNALMEAMVLGLPCISTDCPIGGSSELIKNMENGILVPVGDSVKMAEAITEVLSNSTFGERLRKEAKKIYSSNNLNVITDQWEIYIDEISNKIR